MPVSDLTTPRSAIWSMARQRFPVLHPEPVGPMLTTGLVNGSLRPTAFIALGFSVFSAFFASWLPEDFTFGTLLTAAFGAGLTRAFATATDFFVGTGAADGFKVPPLATGAGCATAGVAETAGFAAEAAGFTCGIAAGLA